MMVVVVVPVLRNDGLEEATRNGSMAAFYGTGSVLRLLTPKL